MSTPFAGVTGFWADLPRDGRWLLSTVVVQFLGRGLTLPFTIIYLHEVRGFELGVSGTLMALIAVVAVLVTGPAGSLVDRYGARRLLLVGLSCALVGNVLLAVATEPGVAAVALALLGVSFGIGWPGINALVSTVVSGTMRQRYFGVNFALLNLGIGIGGVIGGLVVDVDKPATFVAAFLANAASTAVPIVVLLVPLRHLHGRAVHTAEGGPAGASTYLSILRRPEVLWLSGLTFLATFVGYGQMESGFPAFSRQVAEVSTRTIGFAFVVNTVTIVALQFWVLGRVTGRRRTRVLVAMGLVWALAWAVLGAAGLVPGGLEAAVGVLAFHAVFGFGETLMQSTIPAVTNDLAPDHLRGRYNAVNAGAYQGGTIAGPVLAGFLLEHGWSLAFVVAMVGGCAAIALMALALERRVTPAVNGVPEPARV